MDVEEKTNKHGSIPEQGINDVSEGDHPTPNKPGDRIDNRPLMTAEELDAEAVIGICGVEGSGKTVFMTSIFKTIDLMSIEEAIITFDRYGVGGSLYFEDREADILRTGKIEGTRENLRARLKIQPAGKAAKLLGDSLYVNLLDFAGGNFRLIADLPRGLSLQAREQDRERLRQINQYLDNCDGLIILINSVLFGSATEPARENPFPAAVRVLIHECERDKRPLAIVFTQWDMNRRLTQERIDQEELIRYFRGRFSEDSQDKPFGIVELMTCYSLGRDRLPVPSDGRTSSIWKPHASSIFLRVLRASWPRIERRLRDAQQRRLRDRERRSREEQALRDLQRRGRKKERARRWQLFAIAITAFIILGSGAWLFNQNRMLRSDVGLLNRISQQLQAEHAGRATAEERAHAETIIQRYLLGDETVPPRIESALKQLTRHYESAVRRQIDSPAPLNETTPDDISYLLDSESLLPTPRPKWWGEARGRLEAQLGFLQRWINLASGDHQARIEFLGFEKKTFIESGEQAFAAAIDTLLESSEKDQRQQSIKEIRDILSAVDDKSAVLPRIKMMLEKLALIDRKHDQPARLVARGMIARKLVQSMMEIDDNPDILGVITRLIPEFSELPNRDLSLRAAYASLKKHTTAAAYERLGSQLQESIDTARQATENRAFNVDYILRVLTDEIEDPNDRRDVWNDLLGEMEENYIFDLSPQSRLSGVDPLHEHMRAVLGRRRLSEHRNNTLKHILSSLPIYDRELETMQALLHSREVRFGIISIYRELLVYLGNEYMRDPPPSVQNVINLARGKMPRDKPYLIQTRGQFTEQIKELQEIADLTQRAGRSYGAETARHELMRRLRAAISRHCIAMALEDGACNLSGIS